MTDTPPPTSGGHEATLAKWLETLRELLGEKPARTAASSSESAASEVSPPLPDNEGATLVRELDTRIAQVHAAIASFAGNLRERAGDLIKAGDPHDKVPARLAAELKQSADGSRGVLDSLRQSAASNAKKLATARHGSTEQQGLEDSIGALRRELANHIERFAPVIPKLERALAAATQAAGPAIARWQAAQDAARIEHAGLVPQVEKTITDLLNWDDPAAEPLAKRLVGNRRDAHKDYTAALAELRTLDTEARRARTLRTSEYDSKQKVVTQKIAALATRLQALADLQPELQDLAGDPIAAAKSIVETGKNVRALDAAEAMIAQAAEALTELEGCKAAKTGGGEGVLQEIPRLQTAIKKVLGNASYAKLRPVDHAALQAKADTLEKGWLKMGPVDAWMAYVKLDDEVVTLPDWRSLKGRCEAQKTWKTAFDTKAKDCQRIIASLDKLVAGVAVNSGGYEGSLKGALTAIKASADLEQSEASMQQLDTDIAVLQGKAERFAKADMTALTSKGGAAFDLAIEVRRDHMAGVQARLDHEQGLQAFQAAQQQAVARHGALAKDPHAVADPDEYKGIKAQLDAALDSAVKTKDLETAQRMLERAAERLALLQNGGPVIDRSNLGEIQRRWDRGVGSFITQSKLLIAAIDEATAGTNYAGASKNLNEAIVLAAKFLKIDLSAQARVLAVDDPTQKAARKRAREEVLQKIRLCADYLTRNPLIKHAVANPFGVTSLATQLYTAMREIELEVLRGV